MFQLLLTVMAIALTALFMAGGMNYFNSDVGIKHTLLSTFTSQHNAIVMASSAYRNANSGVKPHSISALTGFISENIVDNFPVKYEAGNEPFKWEIESGMLCLQIKEGAVLTEGMKKAIYEFAGKQSSKLGSIVRSGDTCSNAASETEGVSILDPSFTLDAVGNEIKAITLGSV